MEMLEIKEMLWPDGNPERGRAVSGHRPWPDHPIEPERKLVAAVILQALVDAGAGDAEAARWLDEEAPAIAWGWLGIDPSRDHSLARLVLACGRHGRV